MDIADKVVVITGGASGIGFSIVQNFLQNNPKHIIILDKNEEFGREALSKLPLDKVTFKHCDITDLKKVDEILEEIFNTFDTIDILINDAAVLDEDKTKEVIETNLLALIEISLRVWNKIRRSAGGKGGTIFNMASIYGFNDTDGFIPTYQATKHGIIGFTKALGHKFNFDKTDVRVIALCPGFTRTSIVGDPVTICNSDYKEEFHKFLETMPKQDVDDVGKAAVEFFQKAETGSYWTIEGKKLSRVINSYTY